MKTRLMGAVLLSLLPIGVDADIRELDPEDVLKQIAEETSGEAAKRNLDTLTLQHRMRASGQFGAATQHILAMLEQYGLDDVEMLRYAADSRAVRRSTFRSMRRRVARSR